MTWGRRFFGGVMLIALLVGGVAVGARAEVIDTERPGAPRFSGGGWPAGSADPTFWFRRSTDDTGIVEYEVWVNGVLTTTVDERSTRRPDDGVGDPAWTRAVEVRGLRHGPRWIQLVGIDTVGNRSVKSAPVFHLVDSEGPAAPDITGHRVVTASNGHTLVELTYTLGTGSPETCWTLRNLRSDGSHYSAPAGRGPHTATVGGGPMIDVLPGSVWWFQMQCADAYGNTSVRSAPERVDLRNLSPVG